MVMVRTRYIFLIVIFFLVGFGKKRIDDRIAFFPKLEQKPSFIPKQEHIWVFILAGQSNMAGRGKVEPEDTVPNNRILTLNKKGEIILAKEPIHFYEPKMAGLDCGHSFGKQLVKKLPDSISILIIPTAVGGSSINQWIHDSTFRNIPLMTNFKEKIALGKKYGIIKGILWHQGETDASNPNSIKNYDQQLKTLCTLFRSEINNSKLPVIIGELGAFSTNVDQWQALNAKIEAYVQSDPYAYLIKTFDLKDKGDHIHFDSKGQRQMGKRFAKQFLAIHE